MPGALTPVPDRAKTVTSSARAFRDLVVRTRPSACTWPALVEENETLPLKLPTEVGAKVTVKEVDAPGAKVSGRDKLLIEKLAPLNVAALMVRSVAPPFETVTVVLLFEPILTFPKSSEEGFRVSCPGSTALPVTASDARNSELSPNCRVLLCVPTCDG